MKNKSKFVKNRKPFFDVLIFWAKVWYPKYGFLDVTLKWLDQFAWLHELDSRSTYLKTYFFEDPISRSYRAIQPNRNLLKGFAHKANLATLIQLANAL